MVIFFHQPRVRLSKVRVLRKHLSELPEQFDTAVDMSNTPLSEIDPESIHAFVDSKKQFLDTVEGDLKDGKRRVSAAKGPRKRSNADQDDEENDEEPPSDESGSGDHDDDWWT